MSFTQNIQSVAPTLNINFTKSNRLDSRISFSRSSSGTYFNSQGVLTTAATNVPRFQNEFNSTLNRWVPKGLLVEESRTNKASNSVNFISGSTIIPYYEIAPDGTLTALAYQPPSDANSAGTHEKYAIFPGLTINVGDTVTIFAKRKPGSALKFLHLRIFTSGWLNSYNLETGAVSINDPAMPGSMTNVGNGWWRCEFTNFASAGNTTLLRIWVSTNGSIGNATNGDPMYLWGLQSETGINPTSYISTFPLFSSRASSATYYDSTGIIRTAVTNEARSAAFLPSSTGTFARVGTLLESAATNLLQYSEDFRNAMWSKSEVTLISNTPATTAPDGSLNATKLVETSATSVHRLSMSVNPSGFQDWALSVFAKAAERSVLTLMPATTGGGDSPVYFDLSAGTFTIAGSSAVNASMQKLSNGWYRCSVYDGAAGFGYPFIGLVATSGTHSYTGDGTSGVYIWGAQLEVNSFSTSYIKSMPSFTSRASSATYYDVNGILRTAAVNEARSNAYLPDSSGVFRSIGLLYEGAATNLATHSEQLSSWGNNGNGIIITTNSEIAPDGTLTADRLSQSSVTNANRTLFNPASTVRSGQILTTSFWMKKVSGTNTEPSISVCGIGGGPCQTITVTSDWKRYTYTFTAINDGGNYEVGSINIGWNLNGAANNNVYALWGFQVEVGSLATSYISTTNATVTRSADVVSSSTVTRAADVTTSATATRAADNVSISGSNFTNIHNPTENTLVSIGEENLYTLSSTALTINSNSKLDSTVSNLIYYPKALQYASLKSSSAYPAIISDGLVLNLDASSRKSYRTPGATWRDLSINNISATLSNGPTFNSSNSGSIVFDGVDDRITLGTPTALTALFGTNAVSVEVWLRRSANITSQKIVFDSGTNEYIQMDINSNQLSFAIGTPTSVRSARSATLDLDVWYHYVGVYNGTTITTYLNSVQSSQIAQTGNIATDSGGFFIASYTSGFNFPGRIASVKVYNKALSSTEVTQNFNAQRRRFGI
jgi:hypothetical protein